jgi:hypothetical protein
LQAEGQFLSFVPFLGFAFLPFPLVIILHFCFFSALVHWSCSLLSFPFSVLHFLCFYLSCLVSVCLEVVSISLFLKANGHCLSLLSCHFIWLSCCLVLCLALVSNWDLSCGRFLSRGRFRFCYSFLPEVFLFIYLLCVRWVFRFLLFFDSCLFCGYFVLFCGYFIQFRGFFPLILCLVSMGIHVWVCFS